MGSEAIGYGVRTVTVMFWRQRPELKRDTKVVFARKKVPLKNITQAFKISLFYSDSRQQQSFNFRSPFWHRVVFLSRQFALQQA